MHDRLEVKTVRMGNIASHHLFPFKCSNPDCGYEFEFQSRSRMPDEKIIQKMSQRGWLMGRKRSADLCPKCVGVKPENNLARRFKVVKDNEPVATPDEIAKVFGGKREAQANSVVALIKGQEKKPEVPVTQPQPGSPPQATAVDLTPVLEEMKANRVALELLFDQQDKANTLQAQTNALIEQLIRAIAPIVPTLVKNTELIVHNLHLIKPEEPKQPEPEPEPEIETTSHPVDHENLPVYKAPRKPSRYGNNTITVRSKMPRKLDHFKGKQMWLTTIAISQDVVDRAGFQRDDEFKINRRGNKITIERCNEGIRPRTSSEHGISLSLYKLGDCTDFQKCSFTVEKGSIVIVKKTR